MKQLATGVPQNKNTHLQKFSQIYAYIFIIALLLVTEKLNQKMMS